AAIFLPPVSTSLEKKILFAVLALVMVALMLPVFKISAGNDHFNMHGLRSWGLISLAGVLFTFVVCCLNKPSGPLMPSVKPIAAVAFGVILLGQIIYWLYVNSSQHYFKLRPNYGFILVASICVLGILISLDKIKFQNQSTI